jgi:hypothetical protein
MLRSYPSAPLPAAPWRRDVLASDEGWLMMITMEMKAAV